jgi:hypothetical protein
MLIILDEPLLVVSRIINGATVDFCRECNVKIPFHFPPPDDTERNLVLPQLVSAS